MSFSPAECVDRGGLEFEGLKAAVRMLLRGVAAKSLTPRSKFPAPGRAAGCPRNSVAGTRWKSRRACGYTSRNSAPHCPDSGRRPSSADLGAPATLVASDALKARRRSGRQGRPMPALGRDLARPSRRTQAPIFAGQAWRKPSAANWAGPPPVGSFFVAREVAQPGKRQLRGRCATRHQFALSCRPAAVRCLGLGGRRIFSRDCAADAAGRLMLSRTW